MTGVRARYLRGKQVSWKERFYGKSGKSTVHIYKREPDNQSI